MKGPCSFEPIAMRVMRMLVSGMQYAAVLAKTHGHIPEFVNPKYADGTKTKFTSPTRLESMMQDYPKCLGECTLNLLAIGFQ